MPRYVLGDAVWAVHQTGKSLVIEDGKKKSERKFVSEEASAKMLDKLVAEKLAAGYVAFDDGSAVVIVDGQTVLRSPELEATLRANPHDRDAYLVYADWLQSRGDPRGELIVQMVNGLDPMPLLKKHKKLLYGSLINRIVPPHDKPPFIWRNGFIQRVELEREEKYRPISPVLQALLAHPSSALLVEAQLGSDDLADIRKSLDLLVQAAPPLLLLSLVSGSEIGDLMPALTAFTNLRVLVVKVRARNREPHVMAPVTLRSIAQHAPRSLRLLTVRVGSGPTLADLAPLFHRELPNLTTLKIRDAPFGDPLVDLLLAAPFASQIESLDLAMTELDASAERRLRDALPALQTLELTGTEPADSQLDGMVRARFRPGWE
jgi:uncharacterized protein (TIGR02996 family)